MKIKELYKQVKELVETDIAGNYVSFKGRISRRQFCVHSTVLGFFFTAMFMGILLLAPFILMATSMTRMMSIAGIWFGVTFLFSGVWLLSILVRRLHDTGRGMAFLIGLFFAFIIFVCLFGGGLTVLGGISGLTGGFTFYLFVLGAMLFSIFANWVIFYRQGTEGSNEYGLDPLPDNAERIKEIPIWQEIKTYFVFYFQNAEAIYLNNKGRLNRKQYFSCLVGLFLLQFGFQALDQCLDQIVVHWFLKLITSLIMLLCMIALSVMQINITVRRLHDHGLSGMNILWMLVPFVQTMLLLKLTAMTGEQGANEYGVDTLVPGESDDY